MRTLFPPADKKSGSIFYPFDNEDKRVKDRFDSKQRRCAKNEVVVIRKFLSKGKFDGIKDLATFLEEHARRLRGIGIC